MLSEEVSLHGVASSTPVYRRAAESLKEEMYLTDYDASFGATFTCTSSSSVLLRPCASSGCKASVLGRTLASICLTRRRKHRSLLYSCVRSPLLDS